MTTKQSNAMAGGLAQVLRDSPDHIRGDGELLSAFIERRDPSAFAELVRRHGAMVLGVCHRVLRHTQDAEDAFQATFLVLARKAASISPPNAVGNWLYGVAHQTAIRAPAITMKRNARESLLTALPESAKSEAGWDDLVVVLDEELTRLPNYYRAVIVLCDVEGRTRADAAIHLGCPEGSVNSRLSRARAMLAKRLASRGVTLSTSSLALLITQNATTATVPAVLLQSTIEAVAVAAVALSPTVTLLCEGVIRAMLITKLKANAAVVLVFGLLGVGGFTGYRAAVGEEPGPAKAEVKKNEGAKPMVKEEPPIIGLSRQKGIRDDAKGQPPEKRATLEDVVKDWTPALAGAEVNLSGSTLEDAKGKILLPPRVASHFLEVTGGRF